MHLLILFINTIQTNSRGSGRGILAAALYQPLDYEKTLSPTRCRRQAQHPSDWESVPTKDTREGGALVGNPTYAVIPVLSP